MTSSGSYDWTLTANEIATEALDLLGIGQEGETLDAETIARALRALNAMVKTWQAERVFLGLMTEATLPLVAGQGTYTFGPTGDYTTRPVALDDVRLRNASGQDMPLMNVPRMDYFALPNKTSAGVPNQWFYDPQIPVAKLYLWPVPTGPNPGALYFTYQRGIQDFDGSTNTPDFPQEWNEALTYGLAVRLAPRFGRQIDPALLAMAEGLKASMKAANTEGSIYFQPDFGP